MDSVETLEEPSSVVEPTAEEVAAAKHLIDPAEQAVVTKEVEEKKTLASLAYVAVKELEKITGRGTPDSWPQTDEKVDKYSVEEFEVEDIVKFRDALLEVDDPGISGVTEGLLAMNAMPKDSEEIFKEVDGIVGILGEIIDDPNKYYLENPTNVSSMIKFCDYLFMDQSKLEERYGERK